MPEDNVYVFHSGHMLGSPSEAITVVGAYVEIKRGAFVVKGAYGDTVAAFDRLEWSRFEKVLVPSVPSDQMVITYTDALPTALPTFGTGKPPAQPDNATGDQ